MEHSIVIEAFYKAFMGVFCMTWHTLVLVNYCSVADTHARDTAFYLHRALVDQRTIYLFGWASSSLDLIPRQGVETSSTLGNWTPLQSHLGPIPFRGRHLFNGEILQKVDSLDKEEEQLKKPRSFGIKRGSFRNIFRHQRPSRSSTR